MVIPKWLEKPRRLNRISGGNPDPDIELQQQAKRFSVLLQAWIQHGNRLRKVCHPPATDEQTTRNFLHRLGKAAQKMNGDNQREIAALLAPHFADYKNGKSKNCNRFLMNNRGALWKSEYSTSRHQPYDLYDSAYNMDWDKELNAKAEQWRNDFESNCRAKLGDWLALQNLLFACRLQTLQKQSVPRDAARPYEVIADAIPYHWREQLEQLQEIPGDLALRIFNLYHSELRGMLFTLLRENFILRVALQPILGDKKPSFIQLPKTKEWSVPQRLLDSDKAIKSAFTELQENGLCDAKGVIHDVQQAHAHILQKSNETLHKASKKAYFAQAPHEWYLALPWLKDSIPVLSDGLKIDKNGVILSGRQKVYGLRLKGPTAYKNRIVQILLQKWKASEHTLIVEQKYQLTGLRWQDDELTPQLTKSGASTVYGAIPFQLTQPPVAGGGIWERIVAIDLGERGIGYAVFDIREFLQNWGEQSDMEIDENKMKIQPVAKGAVSIPAIRALIRAGQRHRKSAQPRQRMQQSYSSALAERRAAVTGQVCNEIERLCACYNGFPVLEAQVGGFESGGKQLTLIYDSVLRMYRYSGTRAHKNIRQHHWFGHDKLWEHPYLMEHVKSKKENEEEEFRAASIFTDKIEPFKLYPGVVVSASGTSQICAVCGRNPQKAINDKIQVEQGGYANLGDDKIRLYAISKADESMDKQNRQRKLRTPWWKNPLPAGTYNKKEMAKLLKANMRRQPRSLRSKDTSQSRYFCVYIDCQNHWSEERLDALLDTKNNAHQQEWGAHADENAAINIGRRFLFDDIRARNGEQAKLARKQSLEKMLENS